MTEQSPAPIPEPGNQSGSTAPRVFLVVIDDTEEWRAALHFACRRAQHTRGRVALLTVIEPTEFQHFGAVEEIMRQEARQEAEKLLQRVAKDVNVLTGTMPILYIREGARRDELVRLINEEPMISILVLGANPGKDGPGPLVQYLIGKRIGSLRIPVTLVPGSLSREEIDVLG